MMQPPTRRERTRMDSTNTSRPSAAASAKAPRDARTGAERYFARCRLDPEYEAAYQAARRRTGQFDAVVNGLRSRCAQLGLDDADMARISGLRPKDARRLLAGDNPDLALSDLVAAADACGMEVVVAVPASSDA